jgi:hypothetical protein
MAENLQLDKLKSDVIAGLQHYRLCTAFRTNLKAKLLDAQLNQLSKETLVSVLHATHDHTPCWCARPCKCVGGYGGSAPQPDGPCGCGSNVTICKQCRGAISGYR